MQKHEFLNILDLILKMSLKCGSGMLYVQLNISIDRVSKLETCPF